MDKGRVGWAKCIVGRTVAVSGYLSILDLLCEMGSVRSCSHPCLQANGELTCVLFANTFLLGNIPVIYLGLYFYLCSYIWLLL